MRKHIVVIACITLLSGCFIFQKKEKYGCPGSPQPGELSNDQKIASGANVKQTKYKGKKSY